MASIIDLIRGTLPGAAKYLDHERGNLTCPLCGSGGYAGLFAFECTLMPCPNYKPPKAPAAPVSSRKNLFVLSSTGVTWLASPLMQHRARAYGTLGDVGAQLFTHAAGFVCITDTITGAQPVGRCVAVGWYVGSAAAVDACRDGTFGEGDANSP